MKSCFFLPLLAAGALAGPGSRRAAPDFLPLDLDPIYGASRSEVYRTHRVREVFMDQEAFYGSRVATARHLASYQLLNRSGHEVRTETAQNRVIATREDQEYNAAGQPVAYTAYARIGERQDTGRAGLAWMPTRHTRYRTEGTETAGDTWWDAETGRWVPRSRVRSATRHDTTYAETRGADGTLTELRRSFWQGAGRHVLRTDYLTFSARGLNEPKYYYSRTERGQTVESGTVDFANNLEAYLAQHPEAMRYVFGSKRGSYALTDFVARQSTGTLVPTATAVFNRRGQLLTATHYGTRTTYLRDGSGRAQSSRSGYQQQAGNTTAYAYRPDGLLARETVLHADGTPDENRCYRYTFY